MAKLGDLFENILNKQQQEKLGALGRNLNTPTANVLGGAALGIGASVAGNAASGELDDKGLGRVALEALGAGALGAAAGGLGGQFLRKNAINNIDPGKNVSDYLTEINAGMYLDNKLNTAGGAAALLGGAVAAGGLGGLIGGGLSDLAQGAGVPSFGSSNTASAKAGMNATASTAYPANPVGMTNEEMYLASLGYLPMS